ncbi:unnamed protein product [Phytomonas sp. Hart1]|nr:unnamed protein product [Phytomonas sp. Hart1]|eukprot:CCW69982.1 unnamed protein product [Phytomonas sp. isolate Hart1]
MSRYQTGIGDSIPSMLDLVSVFAAFMDDFIKLIFGGMNTSFKVTAMLQKNDPATYDPTTKSWEGSEGLRYRVPLDTIPSERHVRDKVRNIKILMNNCRHICIQDELPSTAEERRFWASYRFMKYQMVLQPFCIVAPPLYVFSKMFHDRLPSIFKGRFVSLMVSLAIAEQWAEVTYPAHPLLSTALKAKTPLGDAARAEWGRLQPIDIPLYLYTAYHIHHFFDTIPVEYQFGGNISSLCS